MITTDWVTELTCSASKAQSDDQTTFALHAVHDMTAERRAVARLPRTKTGSFAFVYAAVILQLRLVLD